MMNSKAIRRSKSTLTRAILYRSTVFESHTAFEKLCTRLGLGFTFLEGNMSERLPSKADVRRVVQEAFDTVDEDDLTLWDMIALMLMEFVGEYEGLQTNIDAVVHAVIQATSASPHTAGFNDKGFVEEVTPELVAALQKAILPPCCRCIHL